EDGFDGFGDAMPANALGPIARHQADDERDNDRNEDDKDAKMISGRRDEIGTPALEKEEVGKKPNEPQQREGDKSPNDANDERQERDEDDPRRGGEVAQLAQRFGIPEALD